ncbi:MAG: WYL domain-containing protein, partial [Vampirovibrionia bacterium]
IIQLPYKSQYQPNNDSINVVFKLTGKLARIYKLYENEVIVEKKNSPYHIIISSNVEDDELLISRLLKYGEFCEILSPFNSRRKIINIINELIKRYTNKLIS